VRVGWLADKPPFTGGAELTAAEFKTAAPEGVTVVNCPPGKIAECDCYVVHNCITYSRADIWGLVAGPEPVFKYWNDTGSWLDDEVRAALNADAIPICCSPLQAEYMDLPDAILIPPPVELERFYDAAAQVNGNRRGAVSAGSWRNRGKGAHAVRRWAEQHGGVDFYGGGAFAPPGSRELAYQGMPAALARYRTFVYLPDVIEPFGRCVVEAWAAGCELIVNGLVGAAWWIENDSRSLETAAHDFWELVT
jgi:hypothetical protein